MYEKIIKVYGQEWRVCYSVDSIDVYEKRSDCWLWAAQISRGRSIKKSVENWLDARDERERYEELKERGWCQ